jgi:hypothetical protein
VPIPADMVVQLAEVGVERPSLLRRVGLESRQRPAPVT